MLPSPSAKRLGAATILVLSVCPGFMRIDRHDWFADLLDTRLTHARVSLLGVSCYDLARHSLLSLAGRCYRAPARLAGGSCDE